MSKRFVLNIFKVVLSNALMLLASIMVAFALPKIMPVEEYGTYKEFSLYFSYAGILHLGFVDAIFIKYSGTKFENVDKDEISDYSFFFLLMQAFVFALFVVISFFVPGFYRFFLFALAYGFFTANITTYFQFFSQAIERFNEFAVRNIIKALLTSLVVIALWLLHSLGILDLVSAKIYIICFLLTNTVLAVWYLVSYRRILRSSFRRLRLRSSAIKRLFLLGFPVMVAASLSNLILLSDRQFAVFFASKEQYAMYAFAYNIASLIVTLVSAVSIVFFPSLKKAKLAVQTKDYSKYLLYVSILAFSFGCFFLPIKLFIGSFLPKYASSVNYLFLLMPAIFMNIIISTININYYKALSMNKRYFFVSLAVLIVAIVTNGLFYLITRSLEALSIASVMTFSIWLIISTNDLIIKLKSANDFPIIYIFIMTLLFYSVRLISDEVVSNIVYSLCWLLASIAFVLYLRYLKNRDRNAMIFTREI